MMHQYCSNSQGHTAGLCSCGIYHRETNSYSMFFSNPNYHESFDHDINQPEMYPYTSSSSSSVDCTLSLGTPSTRMTQNDENRSHHDNHSQSSGSRVSKFCWGLLHPKHSQKSSRTGQCAASTASNNGDPLLARRCANCDTTSTPLWRNGPRGPKSLCNACGIRFKKEERRAIAAAATNSNGTNSGNNYVMDQQNNIYMSQYQKESSWLNPQYSQAQKMQCLSPAAINNEFRFLENDNGGENDPGIAFLSWRLNVCP